MMEGETFADWIERNKTALSTEIDQVRIDLEAFLEDGQAQQQAPAADGEDTTLDHVCAQFGLSSFERRILLMVTGMELDGRFPLLMSRAGTPAGPTFALALAAFADAHWSVLGPDAPLRRWRLVSAGKDNTLVHAPLTLDGVVLGFLLGQAALDEALSSRLAALPPAALLAPSQARQAARLAYLWKDQQTLPVVQFISTAGGTNAAGVAAEACRTLGMPLIALSVTALPPDTEGLEALVRLCERQSRLTGAALLLDDGDDGEEDAGARIVRRLIDRLDCPLLLSGSRRRHSGGRTIVTIEIDKPTQQEQADDWLAALGGAETALPLAQRLAGQFHLECRDILAVRAEAESALFSQTAPAADDALPAAIWEAARHQARPKLDGLGQRIQPASGWADLILPESQTQILQAIAAQLRFRPMVYHDWGFSRTGERGLGLAVLFAGSSGTGKTTAAEVLAAELQLDLYRVDLSQVVSKFIGETEKNLRRVFDAAEQGGVILLFDEADALFGKRTEVRDSHDRYANQEVSYLLQRIEAFRGLAILTSNIRSNLDSAFLRRLRFVVTFPFPDAAMRGRIWQRIFPPDTPTQGLDFARLSQLTLSGGQIRTVALNGAFLAAQEGASIEMRHIRAAAHIEYAKQEKILSDAELQGWPP